MPSRGWSSDVQIADLSGRNYWRMDKILLFWSIGDNFWLRNYCSVITSVSAFTAVEMCNLSWKEEHG